MRPFSALLGAALSTFLAWEAWTDTHVSPQTLAGTALFALLTGVCFVLAAIEGVRK